MSLLLKQEYGDKFIISDKYGDFYIVTREDGEIPLAIDGKRICSVPISKFGFTMDYFNHIPLNKFGFKDVANSGIGTLVLTSNGLFVVYSGGLPSLQGLPSEVMIVSSPWVDSKGDLISPPFSIYTRSQLMTNLVLTMNLSFRYINPIVLTIDTNTICATNYSLSEEKSIKCTTFEKGYLGSQYEDYYPKLTEHHAGWYRNLYGLEDIPDWGVINVPNSI